MLAIWRLAPSVLVVLAIACGGGSKGGGDETSDKTGGDASDLFVSDVRTALANSAEEFAANVDSVRAEFTMDFGMGEDTMSMKGDFAFQDPDQMHMTMRMTGTGGEMFGGSDPGFDLSDFEFEMLASGNTMYMRMPFFGEGWVKMGFDEVGVDASSFEALMDSHSPFDYGAMLKQIGGEIENLGEENGRQHLRFTVDIGDVMNSMMDSFNSSSDTTTTNGFDKFSGPMIMEIWVDSETLLPDQFKAHGEFDAGDKVAGFGMDMKFFDYNKSVRIPEPPKDAKSFSELFGFDFGNVTEPSPPDEFSEVFVDVDGDGVNDFPAD